MAIPQYPWGGRCSFSPKKLKLNCTLNILNILNSEVERCVLGTQLGSGELASIYRHFVAVADRNQDNVTRRCKNTLG